jgi:hypothetical protein
MCNPTEEEQKERHEPTLIEAKKRIKEKSKEIRKKNIVPPVDEDEPIGILSGGSEHVSTDNDSMDLLFEQTYDSSL